MQMDVSGAGARQLLLLLLSIYKLIIEATNEHMILK
jgi:hypothetical protein